MSFFEKEGPKCTMCNRTVIKLVPMHDHDQAHTGPMACRRCKKAIRNDQPIIKFKRSDEKA